MNNFLDRALRQNEFSIKAHFGELNVGALFRTSRSGDYTFLKTEHSQRGEVSTNAIYLIDGEFREFENDDEVYTLETYSTFIAPNGDNVPLAVAQRSKSATVSAVTTNNMKSEENNMFGMNFEFGKVTDGAIKMSLYGLAFVQENGRLASYDIDSQQLTDVTEAGLDIGNDMIFQVPCAITDIKEGDIIKHNGTYVIVLENYDAGASTITAVNPLRGEQVTIIPQRNMFGFNYVTKVVNFMSNMVGKVNADESNPFGNMMPLMLMSSMGESGDKGDMMKTMMMMSMMGGGSSPFGNMGEMNPMMMMLMMK